MKNLELFSKYPELSKSELKEVNGGVICGGLCIGITIAIVVGVIADWDNFKKGVATAFN